MKNDLIHFAIIGCGTVARFHAEAIGSVEGAVLCGVADHDEQRAKAFAESHRVKAYPDSACLLGDPDVDAVCICTPSGFHTENTLAALNVRKHVVLEKPMALNFADAHRLTLAAEKSGLLLTVICQFRFSDDIQKVKTLLKNNAFGKVTMCSLYMKYWRDEQYYASSSWKGRRGTDGGMLMNQGVHGVDELLFLMGDAAVLHAETETAYHKIEAEDTAAALLRFRSGALGTLEASTCSYPGFRMRLEIMGTDGCAVLCENRLEKLIAGRRTLIDRKEVTGTQTYRDPTSMDSTLHARQIANFVRALQGKEKLMIDGGEGEKAVRLIEEIYRFHEKET